MVQPKSRIRPCLSDLCRVRSTATMMIDAGVDGFFDFDSFFPLFLFGKVIRERVRRWRGGRESERGREIQNEREMKSEKEREGERERGGVRVRVFFFA